MNHKTIYGKSQRGGHEAKTLIPMGPVTTMNGPGERILTIHTWKSGRGLLTHASCAVTANGATIMEIFGDYSKRVLLTSARCTEKAVKVQHDAIVGAQLHTVYAEAVAFYQEKDAKNPKPTPMPEPGKFDDTHATDACAHPDMGDTDDACPSCGDANAQPAFDPDATDTIAGGFASLAQAA